ncbi:Lrp/AsnC ligand binding domain-containing protein [Microbacterium sp. Leaf436]|uniref:Lrp/AsnC ligand binding domain-containing protein n=1 Tax=Microbacterium sp. Leaf436 TaxID=1736377 RepID=UPI000B16E687|nr:Lrp/AsnC ligand binding domain-containing protein [Microbacterium sp. Leaf436]
MRTTHAQLGPALQLASQTNEITSTLRVTGEDCLIFDVHCADAARLERIVDSLARYGPVTTALVLREYPPKPLAPGDVNNLMASNI